MKKNKKSIIKVFEEPKLSFNIKNITTNPMSIDRTNPTGLKPEIKLRVMNSSTSFENANKELFIIC
jgi:hypothetical protein